MNNFSESKSRRVKKKVFNKNIYPEYVCSCITGTAEDQFRFYIEMQSKFQWVAPRQFLKIIFILIDHRRARSTRNARPKFGKEILAIVKKTVIESSRCRFM